MKLQKLISLMLLLSFVSCASNEKSSDSGNEATDLSGKMTTPSQSSDLNANLKKSGVAPLDAAVQSQNDDSISQSASEILVKNPKDVRALNALGMVYFKRGRLEAAEYLLNKALAVDANRSELYSNLGLVKMAQGEKREAIKIFRKGLELNSQDSVIGANLGSIYVKEKDYSKAELSLEIPIKKGSKDIKILNNYAIALTGTGKYDKAQDLYEKLMKENPGQRDIMLNYSILMIDHKRKFREGLDLINRLKFVGVPMESRNLIKDLESKAKAGLK